MIRDRAWIGPQSYFDARDLVIEEYVGWGPGARVLGSMHTGIPADVPIIQTDLTIRPVRIGAWSDIGVGAVVLPGVHVGKGAIVGAGAVVTTDVEPFTIVAGVPARFLHRRDGAPEAEKCENRRLDNRCHGWCRLIGSTTVDQLLRHAPRRIVIFDDFSRGTRANLATAAADARVQIVEGDIRDRDAVARARRALMR